VIRNISHYRKNFICDIKSLTYLDDRPVFPKERACAEAWRCGGREAEHRERQRWVEKEQQRIMNSVKGLANIRARAMARQQQSQHQGTVAGDKTTVRVWVRCNTRELWLATRLLVRVWVRCNTRELWLATRLLVRVWVSRRTVWLMRQKKEPSLQGDQVTKMIRSAMQRKRFCQEMRFLEQTLLRKCYHLML
jgi:hypothetical protein